MESLDKVPKTNKEYQRIKSNGTEIGWDKYQKSNQFKFAFSEKSTKQELEKWADVMMDKDQEHRTNPENQTKRDDLFRKLKDLNITISSSEDLKNFLNTEASDQEVQKLQKDLKKIIDESNNVDIANQESLKDLMQAIDGFPSIEEFGINVVNTAWIITQHADNDIGFQQRVLQEMYKTKNNNETGVNLVCFYYFFIGSKDFVVELANWFVVRNLQ